MRSQGWRFCLRLPSSLGPCSRDHDLNSPREGPSCKQLGAEGPLLRLTSASWGHCQRRVATHRPGVQHSREERPAETPTSPQRTISSGRSPCATTCTETQTGRVVSGDGGRGFSSEDTPSSSSEGLRRHAPPCPRRSAGPSTSTQGPHHHCSPFPTWERSYEEASAVTQAPRRAPQLSHRTPEPCCRDLLGSRCSAGMKAPERAVHTPPLGRVGPGPAAGKPVHTGGQRAPEPQR